MDASRIHIVGLGVAEHAELSASVKQLVLNADLIIGSERQLKTIRHLGNALCNNALDNNTLGKDTLSKDTLSKDTLCNTVPLPKLSGLKTLIDNNSDEHRCIVVLASGDPLHYGIGAWFSKHFAPDRLRYYPAVSSIQVACHRLGCALQDVTVLSLHGRPLEKLRTRLKHQSTLIVLTDRFSSPQALAEECMAAGFEQSSITVCENLGYAQEHIRQFTVSELTGTVTPDFDPLHISIIEVKGQGGKLPEFPGIADTQFETGAAPGKGMISKREVRLTILSLLQPANGDIIWDVGAGCGGVAIELAYWNERTRVYAIEHHPERLRYLAMNQQRFGVTGNLSIVVGTAPDCLAGLPAANKVFIGGSDGHLEQLLQLGWQQLPGGGMLVASAVIDSTRQQLRSFAESVTDARVESVEVAVKRGELKEGKLDYATRLPVEIYSFVKTGAG